MKASLRSSVGGLPEEVLFASELFLHVGYTADGSCIIKNAVEAFEGTGLDQIRDPAITVTLEREAQQVRVSVSDNGKGWPKENRGTGST